MERYKLLEAVSYEHTILDSLSCMEEFGSGSVSCDTVLELSEKLEPSIILGFGGILFESFIMRQAPPRIYAAFLSLYKQNNLLILVNLDLQEKIIKRFAVPFWFYIIQTIASIHRTKNKPLAQFTLNLEFRGLSRFGIEILHACGVASHPTTHDRKRNERLVAYDEENKRIALEGKAMIAVDNYSHFYGSATVSLNRTNQLLLANNTVCGLSEYRQEVDTTFVYTPSGDIRPSVPPHREILATYVDQFMENLAEAIADTNEKTSSPYLFWEISRVVRENVNTVPLRPNVPHPKDDEPHSRGLKYYRPWFISHFNSASNMGTAKNC